MGCAVIKADVIEQCWSSGLSAAETIESCGLTDDEWELVARDRFRAACFDFGVTECRVSEAEFVEALRLLLPIVGR